MDKIFIPLGNSCSISYNLKVNNLRKFAYPFDWVRIQNLNNISLLIQNNFDGFLDLSKFRFKYFSNKFNVNNKFESYIYSNEYCTFFHDFDNYIEKFDASIFIKKYERRIKRFLEVIKSNNKLIFIREEFGKINKNKIYNFISVIKNINPKIDFYLIIITNKYIEFEDINVKCYVSDKPISDWTRPEINWDEIFNLF